MKSHAFLHIALFLVCVSTICAGPSQADDPGTEAARERIEALEAELSAAQREVARLEAELVEARQDLATPGGIAHLKPGADRPLAITRLDETALRDGDVRDAARIAPLVPGMLYSQTGLEARFALRGAHTNRTGPESEPVLAIFEDGVPVTTTTDALAPYVDIESIDVLRGPQGVMIGRNALAGAVEINSNKPDMAAWDTALEGTIGHSDLTRFEAMLNIPVLDTLAVRLAGASETYQGYINNYVLEESDADDLKTRAQQYVRLGVRWQPRPDFSLQLNFVSLDQNGTGSGIWGYQQIGAMIDGEYHPGHQFAPPGASMDFGPLDIARNMDALAELENLSTSLVLDWDLGFATLRWLANKSKFESLQAFDADYSNGGSTYDSKSNQWDAGVNGWDSFMDTWYSDLRLQSRGQGRFDWFTGLNFLSQETDWGWLETVNSVLLHPAWDLDGQFSKVSAAVYGGAGYRLNERVRVFAGLRWYEDDKQLRDGTRDRWDGVLWNAGLEYALTDRTSSYLTAATGYRPAGLNEVYGYAIPPLPSSYDPETVNAFEIGLHTQLLGGAMTLDLAAFLHDYQDVQAHQFVLHFQTGASGMTTIENAFNAGGKQSMGLEAELQWSPDEHWHIAAQLAWLDAEFDNYNVPGLWGLGEIPGHSTAEGLRLDGWQPAFSPEWMAALQAGYLFDMGRWGSIRPLLHTSFFSDYYTNDLNLPGALQEAHSVTDLRLFWRLPGDKVSLQLYIENFTSGKVLNSTMIYNPEERPDIATFLADWSDTQRYGLTLSYRY